MKTAFILCFFLSAFVLSCAPSIELPDQAPVAGIPGNTVTVIGNKTGGTFITNCYPGSGTCKVFLYLLPSSFLNCQADVGNSQYYPSGITSADIVRQTITTTPSLTSETRIVITATSVVNGSYRVCLLMAFAGSQNAQTILTLSTYTPTSGWITDVGVTVTVTKDVTVTIPDTADWVFIP